MFSKSGRFLHRITDVGPTVSATPNINQDMPPEGGFPPVRLRKGNPNRLWGLGATSAFLVGMMAYGWWKVSLVHKKQREFTYEQQTLEMAMAPFLQAEHDISFTVQIRAFKKAVEKLMKDDETFDAYEHFYKNKHRFIYPAFSIDLGKFLGTGILETDKVHEQFIADIKKSLQK
jgi:NADH dehydrogenase (ubiquinone) 1 alpha subcomplex subunit 13